MLRGGQLYADKACKQLLLYDEFSRDPRWQSLWLEPQDPLKILPDKLSQEDSMTALFGYCVGRRR